MSESNDRVIATNRQAKRNYELFDSWEAGLVLSGSEVKSLRESKVQISEAFGREEDRELWIIGLHISPYRNNPNFAHDPDHLRNCSFTAKKSSEFLVASIEMA